MRRIKNIFVITLFFVLFTTRAWAVEAWNNDLKSLFLSNNAIIYVLNVRTFNANDKNKNGIIEQELGEESGTFLNAISRLDELKAYGINTIHVLPITPVGKVKAMGSAGSLYAASSFNELNPQLKSKTSNLTITDEAKQFITECHNRKIRVIVDLPSCGAFDLYLRRPELFKKDKSQNPVIPLDWTDVRLLDAGNNSKINMDVYNLYAEFVDLMLSLDVDGIRADVATIKPYEFWRKLIAETKARNPEFLFLAEASDSWRESPSEYAEFTPYDKLLDAGFDGYYGSYFNLKNWKTSQDLFNTVKFNINLSKKYAGSKTVIGSFSTHDEVSPILINGVPFSKMIIWLNATLPLNSYFVDGFQTGDDYIYPCANKKAAKSFTDDDYYFVHRGKLDIFNLSRKPMGRYYDIVQDFILGNKFKVYGKDVVTKGNFVPLKCSSASVFAYARSFNKQSIIVIGNLNFQVPQEVKVYVPNVNSEMTSVPIRIVNIPQIKKGKILTKLNPGEVQVLYFNDLELK